MSITICLAQSKGGTSKTSSVINIGAGLLKAGHKVLAVDVDQQASLTLSLGIEPSSLKQSMRALLIDPAVTAEQILVPTQEGIDLLPANLDLSMVEFHMPAVGREKVLSKKLRPMASKYDFVLIDTPPSFAVTTLNAMSASNYLLVPIQPEPLCLLGMAQLTEAFNLVKQNTNPRLKMLGVFIALYDGRIRNHREIAEQIREDWGDLAFKSFIRRRSNMLDSTLEGRSMISLNLKSEVAQDYQALTREVLQRVNK